MGAVVVGGAGYGVGALLSRDEVYNFRGETQEQTTISERKMRRYASIILREHSVT